MEQQITLYKVGQFAKTQPGLTEAALRWQIFNSQENGLQESGAIRRVGRRVYIIAERYLAWLDGQGKAA